MQQVRQDQTQACRPKCASSSWVWCCCVGNCCCDFASDCTLYLGLLGCVLFWASLFLSGCQEMVCHNRPLFQIRYPA